MTVTIKKELDTLSINELCVLLDKTGGTKDSYIYNLILRKEGFSDLVKYVFNKYVDIYKNEELEKRISSSVENTLININTLNRFNGISNKYIIFEEIGKQISIFREKEI